MCMTALVALLVTLTVSVAAIAAGTVALTMGQFLRLTATLVGGSLAFSAIGLLIGSRVGGTSAPAFVNLLYLPMVYLSGVLIPLPKSFDTFTHVSPAYHLDRLALMAVGSPGDDAMGHVIVLAAVTIALGALAIRRLARAE
jgi:ABC-2 type transport system permease protein